MKIGELDTLVSGNIISIRVAKGTIVKAARQIIRVQGCSNYCRVYCADEAYPITVARVLAWFESKLPEQDFIRTHRSHLINKHYVRLLTGNEMILQNGDAVGISRRRRNELKKIA